MSLILERRDGHVATLVLNRPERMNVWNAEMEVGLRDKMAALSADEEVRVIVLTGCGKAFCAGVDVGALEDLANGGADISQPPAAVKAAMGAGDFEQRYTYLLEVPKPIICAINGAAAGVGLVLSLYCDIRYASSRAKLAASFARRGLVAEHGIAWMLPRLVGLPRALEWLLSGRTLTAAQALAMGVVSDVYEADAFETEVAARAQELALSVSPRSVRIMKRQIYEAASLSLAQACKNAAMEVSAAIRSDDFREGVQHFMEGRAPHFTGR